MKIQFHGATGMVTGSCALVRCGASTFLVDCGLFQGSPEVKAMNFTDFPFSPADIDFVLLTHAHIDHSGRLPKLVRQGFKGPILATAPTCALCTHMLPDSGRIQESDVADKNKRLERLGQPLFQPLYTEADALATVARFKDLPLGERREVAPGVEVRFRNAGHILGSAFIEVWLTEDGQTRKIVFSGDIGAPDHPIIQDPETFDEADHLVVESTYGDRAREPEPPEARRDELARIILETCPAGGNLIIPGFAVGRTQDLLHDILMLLDEQRIPGTQVWVDSPLAVAVSQVFLRFPGDYDGDARELLVGRQNLFDSPWFHFTQSQEQSMALNDVTGSIIISASGMCDAGRIKHHLRHNVYKPANTILFVGYQAEGTLGRRMVDGARQITIHGRTLAVRAKIEQIRGYSGHADQGQLMAWLGAIHKLRSTLFVVHGEDAARQALAELAREQLGFSTRIPSLGEAYDLLAPQEPERVAHARSAPAFAPPPPAQAPREDPYPRFLLDLASALRRAETEEARRTLFDRLHDALRSS